MLEYTSLCISHRAVVGSVVVVVVVGLVKVEVHVVEVVGEVVLLSRLRLGGAVVGAAVWEAGGAGKE
jgi:hypothetical protein